MKTLLLAYACACVGTNAMGMAVAKADSNPYHPSPATVYAPISTEDYCRIVHDNPELKGWYTCTMEVVYNPNQGQSKFVPAKPSDNPPKPAPVCKHES